MKLWFAVAVGAIAVVAVSAAWADIVHLRGGGRIEGAVKVEGDKIIVASRYGHTTLASSDVEHIEKSDTALDKYNKLAANAAAGDLKAQRELANFCREHKLASRQRYHLLLILRLRPDDIEARSALGYVRRGKGWLTRSREMYERGLVRFRGKWVTPGAKEAVRSREREKKLELAAKRRREREERAAKVRANRLARRQREQQPRESQGYLGISYVDDSSSRPNYSNYYRSRYNYGRGRHSITSPYYGRHHGGYYYPYDRYTGGWTWYRRWTGAGLPVNYRSRNWRVRWGYSGREVR